MLLAIKRMNMLVIVWLIYFQVLFCVCRNILFLNVNWAFVVVAIGGQICTVNQLNKQFNSSHIIATGLSLHIYRFYSSLPAEATAIFFSAWSPVFSLNTITQESLYLTLWNFARTCTLTTFTSLLNIKVIGQRSRSHVFMCTTLRLPAGSTWSWARLDDRQWGEMFACLQLTRYLLSYWVGWLLCVFALVQDLSYRDKHWHDKCFKCSSCSTSLVNESFAYKNDQLHCAACYELMFAPRCTRCKEVFRAGTPNQRYLLVSALFIKKRSRISNSRLRMVLSPSELNEVSVWCLFFKVVTSLIIITDQFLLTKQSKTILISDKKCWMIQNPQKSPDRYQNLNFSL